MKLTKQLAIALTATAGVLTLGSNAWAGEGGAAGAAAFSIGPNSVVRGVAVAAAIGKQNAVAGAFNDAGLNENTAFAQGSAGVITMTGLGSLTVGSISSTADPALGTAQANTFAASTTVLIGTGSGDPVVVIGP